MGWESWGCKKDDHNDVSNSDDFCPSCHMEAQQAEIDRLKAELAAARSEIDTLHEFIAAQEVRAEEFTSMSAELAAAREENKRLVDGIYSMIVGPEEQARKIDPVQWIKTRLIHVEHYNEALTQAEIKNGKELAKLRALCAARPDINDCPKMMAWLYKIDAAGRGEGA